MIFSPTPLSGCYEVIITPTIDDRGWFGRYFCVEEFKQIGHTDNWLQINHSFSSKLGTIRGMHFQVPPFQEVKLVRCISGIIFDVVIDLRANSETFLHWYGTHLSSDNKKMMYIPKGFAHGFQTLIQNSELLYHHTALYNPGSEGGIRFDDPMVNIKWPLKVENISSKDMGYSFLDENFKGF